MDLTKEEILQTTDAADVLRWMQRHLDEDCTEVAALFNKLAREEFERNFPEYAPSTHIDLNSREVYSAYMQKKNAES